MRHTHPTRAVRLVSALVAVLLVSACGGPADPADEPATPGGAPTGAPDDPGVDDPVGDEPAVDDPVVDDPVVGEPAGPADPDDRSQVPDVTVSGRSVTVSRPDGTDTVTIGADEADEILAVLLHPGWTADDLDVVVVTFRGEVSRFVHLAVRDGAVRDPALFPAPYQPQTVLEGPVTVGWTPDARSLVWTEPVGDSVVLRTVGWDGGPGTGRTADDNAAFQLDLPADVQLEGFVVHTSDAWTLQLVDGLGQLHELAMERQADGALALPPAA